MGKLAWSSVIGLILVGVIGWSGCGGGDSTTVTKAEFNREAITICKQWQQGREAVLVKFGVASNATFTRAKQEKAILMILAPYETAVRELGELPSPPGDKARVDGVVRAMEEAVRQAQKAPLTVTSGRTPFKKPNELAERYGLTECKV